MDLRFCAWVLAGLASWIQAADPVAPAVIVVSDNTLASDIEPLGLNAGILSGGTNNATNQLFPNPGFEPIVIREIQRVTAAGADWFEFENMTWFELRGTGFGNGARIRFFRLVDAQSKPLPFDPGSKLDVSRAHHVIDLGEAKVPMPDARRPMGGWVATKYGSTGFGGGEIRYNTSFTDPCYYAGDGETGWYVIKAVDASGNESPPSNEVSATPSAKSAGGPKLVGNGGNLPNAVAGAGYWTSVSAVGGVNPYQFSIIAGALPEGVTLDSASGILSGTVTAAPKDLSVTLQVKDAAGRADSRLFRFNAPADIRSDANKDAPQPPTNVKTTANNGSVTLTWTASASPDVAYYKVLRSDVPAAQQQERIYLDRKIEIRPGDHAFIYIRTDEMPATASHFRVRTANSGSAKSHAFSRDGWTCRTVPHPAPVPQEFVDRGQRCLEITSTVAAKSGGSARPVVFYPWQGYTGEDKWYSQLHPNTKYRTEVWLRQDGKLGDDGRVFFVLNGCYAELNAKIPWTTGTQWKKFSYEFTSPAEYPTKGGHSGPGLVFTGPGKLYVDNFILYRVDDDHTGPNVPVKFAFDEILASMPASGKKGCLRLYGMGFGDISMEANTELYGDSTYTADWYTAVNQSIHMTLPVQMEYALRTGNSPETRMVPMLTVSPDFFPEEWKAMVEFLGVPYDPTTDSPKSKPYAYKRYLQRGRTGKPWTEEFREIVIEIGNETWHNKALPQWDGFGWTGAVMQGGKEYGLFARFIIDETVMKMPEWKSLKLGEKIKWALGANYSTDLQWGYGEVAMAQGAGASYLGHANYVGPKWETGDAAEKTFTDDGVQKTLLGFWMNETAKDTVDGAAKSRDALNSQGKADYRLLAYEGGPSGYDHRDLTNLTSELYGKSEAMAVAAMDAWLHSSAVGYQHQCYLGYGSGYGWSSHTMPEAGGFRVHAGWLALKMRNRYAKGDRMIEATVESGPTLSLKGKDWPLVGAYAMKDSAGNYSVIVLSRKLDGRHSGADLGDGYTPVTIRLPFASAKKITLHKLAKPDGTPADPRDNNFESDKVAIVSTDIPVLAFNRNFAINAATGGGAKGLPPGGLYLYVFEGCRSAEN